MASRKSFSSDFVGAQRLLANLTIPIFTEISSTLPIHAVYKTQKFLLPAENMEAEEEVCDSVAG